jgi:hypothetical protein
LLFFWPAIPREHVFSCERSEQEIPCEGLGSSLGILAARELGSVAKKADIVSLRQTAATGSSLFSKKCCCACKASLA